jgi:NTP pyrophosphatase (non-canonical NTP hydrolase)
MHSTDTTTTVAELKDSMAAFAHERDWEQFHTPKNLSMAIAAEAGELMEHFLWATSEESAAQCAHPIKRIKIEEELADIILFALQFANMAKIDVSSIVEAKIAQNALKYPIAKAKGRSDKYTEL